MVISYAKNQAKLGNIFDILSIEEDPSIKAKLLETVQTQLLDQLSALNFFL